MDSACGRPALARTGRRPGIGATCELYVLGRAHHTGPESASQTAGCGLHSFFSSIGSHMVSPRTRRVLGLAVLIVAFFGGIIGWSCAALSVDPVSPTPQDKANTGMEMSPPSVDPAEQDLSDVVSGAVFERGSRVRQWTSQCEKRAFS